MIAASTFAQQNVNNYKYVIVPVRFDFAKKTDQYQTSSLTKFLFNKYGFTTFLSNEKLPDDLAKNRCKALTGRVKDLSGVFKTKVSIELTDCYNKVVFLSKEGKTKSKDYKKGYHEAIRNAFKSIQSLKYKYDSSKEFIKKEKNVSPSEIVEVPKDVKIKEIKIADKILFAQPILNGFQIIDSKPQVVFRIMKTNVKDVFIIKDKNGLLYKKDNIWIAEYYKNKERVIESYQLKF